MDAGIEQGPLINERQQARVKRKFKKLNFFLKLINPKKVDDKLFSTKHDPTPFHIYIFEIEKLYIDLLTF